MTPAEIAAGLGPEGVTSYDARTMPNTLDPDVFYDAKGRLWMLYGSYSGGLFILEMDEKTAKPKPGQGYGRHLAGGDHAPIEGGYMLYSPETAARELGRQHDVVERQRPLVRRQRGNPHPAQHVAASRVLGRPRRGLGVHRRRRSSRSA
jgi:hypothetical protein